MNFRNISAWSIRNPVVPIIIFMGLVLVGAVSFVQMKIQDMPDVEFPAVMISIDQPGAAPVEIEKQITQRVEAAARTISGVDSISSTATEGNSTTYVMFQIGVDINEAVNDVRNAVDQARGELPEGILEPRVSKIEGRGNEIAAWAITAQDMTVEQLSWFVDDTVSKRLLSIPGMAEVKRGGGVTREIRVTLDPARMQSLGISAGQVNTVLKQLNINAAGGKAEIAGSRQSVRVLGNAATALDLAQKDVPLGGGRTVKLADFANVTDSFGEIDSAATLAGKPVVVLDITRARGASDVSVYDATVAELAKIEKERPGVKFTRLYSSVDYTKAQYESSVSAMVEGAILAVIVVFFFLRDWRATVISAIAIPLSAIPTFWFLYNWFGFSLNSISMLALGLVAGVLVDDAIVEIENIVRHMRMGKSAYQAAIDAADEIGLAVVATTFSIVAVFLPVGLMGGIPGQFFKSFGLTVVTSVLLSLAVARTITPMVAAYFLRAHGHAEHASGPWMDRYLAVLSWTLDTSKVTAYKRALAAAGRRLSIGRRIAARLRDHRLWMVGVGVVALALTGLLLYSIPKQFFPSTNSDFSMVNIEMVPGTTLAQTQAVADQVSRMASRDPDVSKAFSTVREGSAKIFINLKRDRSKTSQEFERGLTPAFQQIPDARISFLDFSSGAGGGGGTGRPISIMLSGSDANLLDQTAATLVEQMKGIKGLVAPRVAADMRRPEIVIKPLYNLAASLGVTTSALSQTIRIATIGDIDQNVAKFSLEDRQVPIRVRLSEDSRRDLSTIRNLPVQTASGGSVPLSSVADISFGTGPVSVQRYNQSRRVFVGADLGPGVVKGNMMDAINALPIMKNLPAGVSNAPFGQDRWQAEMFASFAQAVLAGVLLVFSVLVLLYHRFVSPLVNMGSLFLAPLGGMLLLLVLGQPISMPVIIGILMLLGIVAKNSILLIDFAIEEMANGASKLEAIMEAGHKRAQPIIMTTVAMTAGMVPTAISVGGDGAWRAPMGTVVIGGLLLSTLLTLLIVPAAFSLADGLEKRIGPKLRKSILTYEPEHAARAHYPSDGRPEEAGAVPAE
jgi:multidrug efflux pump subunit AcrB